MKMCAFEGCPNKASPKASGGLCSSHYWQKHKGRPLTPLSYRRNVKLDWLDQHKGYQGDDCISWPYSSGRGQVKAASMVLNEARYMCMLAHGAPPSDRHEAAHSCGNGHLGCINPRHLRWATPAENKADMIEHGTRVRGERTPWSILTEERVRAIRELHHTCRVSTLSRLFGLHPAHVSKVVNRTIWRHVA